MHTRHLTLVAILMLGACVAPPSPPAPRTASAPPAILAAPAPTPRLTGDWNDWPFSPGNWNYSRDSGGSVGQFGLSGGNPIISLRCNSQARRVILSRAASAPGQNITVRTSSTTKTLSAKLIGASANYISADIATADPILDAMAFSRGRVLVEVDGQQPVVLPAWAEITRVVEDCRR